MYKLLVMLVATVFLSACFDTDKQATQNIIEDQNNLSSYQQKLHKEKIKQQLTNYHAMLASKKKYLCPKLLRKALDETSIELAKEHLMGQYCDYYIYPKAGQTLSVTSNNSKLKIRLNEPSLHNFANGEYLVKDEGRHVIRVSYAGVKYKPDNVDYTIHVTFK